MIVFIGSLSTPTYQRQTDGKQLEQPLSTNKEEVLNRESWLQVEAF